MSRLKTGECQKIHSNRAENIELQKQLVSFSRLGNTWVTAKRSLVCLADRFQVIARENEASDFCQAVNSEKACWGELAKMTLSAM